MEKLVNEIIEVDKKAKALIDDALLQKEEILRNVDDEVSEVTKQRKQEFEKKSAVIIEQSEDEVMQDCKKINATFEQKKERINKEFEAKSEQWETDIFNKITQA